MYIIPYFTHRKLVNWINDAGQSLDFDVKSERRRITHGKIFQMDSMWFKNQKLFAFLEAEKRWEINHIIGHLTCCADYATQEKIHPFFILVFLENETNHCKRLDETWNWLTRMVPSALKIRCLPIYTKRGEKKDILYASTITKELFNEKFKALIKYR